METSRLERAALVLVRLVQAREAWALERAALGVDPFSMGQACEARAQGFPILQQERVDNSLVFPTLLQAWVDSSATMTSTSTAGLLAGNRRATACHCNVPRGIPLQDLACSRWDTTLCRAWECSSSLGSSKYQVGELQ